MEGLRQKSPENHRQAKKVAAARLLREDRSPRIWRASLRATPGVNNCQLLAISLRMVRILYRAMFGTAEILANLDHKLSKFQRVSGICYLYDSFSYLISKFCCSLKSYSLGMYTSTQCYQTTGKNPMILSVAYHSKYSDIINAFIFETLLT